jgi:hypothetical protein
MGEGVMAIDGGQLSASHAGRYIQGEMFPDTLCMRGWVGHRTGVKLVREKFPAPTEKGTHSLGKRTKLSLRLTKN